MEKSLEPKVIDLPVYLDDRGSLYEVVHHYDLPQDNRWAKSHAHGDYKHPARFGQVYVVNSPSRGTIRAFHRHRELWDYFCIVSGRAKFVVVQSDPSGTETDNPSWTETAGIDEIWTFVLGAEKPRLLVVPPMFWHGWEALTDNTILVSLGTDLYDRDNPDEQRIAAKAFGDVWGIKPR